MTGVRTGMETLGMGFLLAAADGFLDAYAFVGTMSQTRRQHHIDGS